MELEMKKGKLRSCNNQFISSKLGFFTKKTLGKKCDINSYSF